VGLAPTPATMELLASIWRRVLQRPSVRADDNFFDLGGDPSSAIQLLSEIARISGRELPPITIYQAPTLAALAALLDQPEQLQFGPLVPLKAGTTRPLVFMAHGLGGSVMEIFDLAKRIQTQHALYGTQSKRVTGTDQPMEHVEDLAQYYLDAMRKLQPHGPYALIGYSFGGLVMLEVAHRLRQSGETIALLAMLETYPHRKQLSTSQRIGLYVDLAKRHAMIAGKLPARKKIAYVTSSAERRLYASWDDDGNFNPPTAASTFSSPAMKRVRDAEGLAWERYRPRFYGGRINFVQAAKGNSMFPHNPTAVWLKLAEELEIDIVPGNHFGIITTHCQELASVLTRHLAAAFSGE
jgi:acetoacetyl-CoA synthetase